MEHVLSWMVFTPLIGMVVVLCLPSRAHTLIKQTAFAFTLPPLVLGINLFRSFDRTAEGFQYLVRAPWIASYNIDYFRQDKTSPWPSSISTAGSAG